MTRHPKASKWTIKELNAVPVTWKGDTISDGGGLSGEVRVNGGSVSIIFRFAFKWEGKVKWHYCGAYPTVDLADIRAERDKAREAVGKGIDPRVQKVAAKIEAREAVEAVVKADEQRQAEILTFADLFNAGLEGGAFDRKDGNKDLIQVFNKNALPVIGCIEIRKLSEIHLRNLYRDIVNSGRKRAAVLLSRDIGQILRWGEKRQPWRSLLANGNPCDLVNVNSLLPKNYTNKRGRILADIEIIRLKKILDLMRQESEHPLKLENELALWIMLSALTRIGETMLAEWCHIDFERREWFIPKENVKGRRGKKRDQLVSMSDFTFNQFCRLHKLTGMSKYAFPGSIPDRPLGEKVISKQVTDRQIQFTNRNKKLDYRIEDNSLVLDPALGNWTPHDLRRTGATGMQRLGIQVDIIKRCQNRVVGSSVDQVYLLHDYKSEKKEAWARLGNWLTELLANIEQSKP
ncbi:MAG: tyrosine-type recombinase/integrase [Sulfuriferula sp.]